MFILRGDAAKSIAMEQNGFVIHVNECFLYCYWNQTGLSCLDLVFDGYSADNFAVICNRQRCVEEAPGGQVVSQRQR